MKYTVTALTTLILVLVMVIVWQNGVIIGQINDYKGIPQIELRTTSQFNVLPVAQKTLKIGYLKNTIPTYYGFDSADFCGYTLKSDFEIGKSNAVASAAWEGSGIVLNINGSDVFVKGGDNDQGDFLGEFGSYKVKIPDAGALKECTGQRCAVPTFIVITNNSGYKDSIPVVLECP